MSHIDYLRGHVHNVGWEPPSDFSEDEWKSSGELLGKSERSIQWLIGDWWIFGNNKWGKRSAIVQADKWDGPSYEISRKAGYVAERFEIGRRRPNSELTFKHFREVAELSSEAADHLLDEAETNRWSTRELRAAVHRLRTARGRQPSSETGTVSDLNDLIAAGKKFGCIYADPPWLYDNQGTRASTENHYLGMTTDELCEMPIEQLALPDAHLHLWTTNGFLFDAPRIIKAWGFVFRSSFVWVKSSIGIGNYWRNSHEFLLTAIRGNATHFHDHSLRSWMESPRDDHSAKPEEIREMIERASPAPFLELFGRLKADGWTVWGNQVESIA